MAYAAPGVASFNNNVQSIGTSMNAAPIADNADLTRLGTGFQILSAATAALTGLPTTTAGHSLFNGDSQKCYYIHSFGCVEITVDATQQNSIALFACNSIGPVTAPSDAGLTRGSMLGNRYGGSAKTAAAASITNDGWYPHQNTPPSNTQLTGSNWRVYEACVDGLYVVRPNGQFNIAVAKSAATASQIQYFIRWREVLVPFAS